MRKLQYIPIAHILPDKRLFEVNYMADLTALRNSLQRQGVLQPIRLQKFASDRFQIIAGFRRFDCANQMGLSTMPALIYEALDDDLSLFESAIEENFFNRSYNTIEKGIIIEKLKNRFDVPRDIIINKYMPFLGLEKSEKIFRFYEGVMGLDEAIKVTLIRQQLPIHLVEDFLRFALDEQREFIPYLESFQFSVSSLKEFLVWSHEIILRDRISLATFLREPAFQEIFLDEATHRHQKLQKIRKLLKLRRYPKLMELETTFAELKRKLGLPLEAPNFFEDDRVRMNFSFKDKKEFEKWIDKMKVALSQDEMEEMINIL